MSSTNIRENIRATTKEFVYSWDVACQTSDATKILRACTDTCTRRVSPLSILTPLNLPDPHNFVQSNEDAVGFAKNDIEASDIKTFEWEDLTIDVEARKSVSRTSAELIYKDGSGTMRMEWTWFLDFNEDGTKVERVREFADSVGVHEMFRRLGMMPTEAQK